MLLQLPHNNPYGNRAQNSRLNLKGKKRLGGGFLRLCVATHLALNLKNKLNGAAGVSVCGTPCS